MNKPGGAPGGGGSTAGPTAAAAAAAAQKQRALLQKADTDVASLVDNFSALINIARVRAPPPRLSRRSPPSLLGAPRVLLTLLPSSSSLQVNDPPVRNSQEEFQMEMRASRMVTTPTTQLTRSLPTTCSEISVLPLCLKYSVIHDPKLELCCSV